MARYLSNLKHIRTVAHFRTHRRCKRLVLYRLAHCGYHLYVPGKCELLHNEICYFLLKTGPVWYESAKYFCERQGAQAANIYDKDQYQAVLNFLRQKMLPMDSVWIGMTKDSMVRKSRQRNVSTSAKRKLIYTP